ncbi:hypothetical protein P4H42_31940 [Paenibacillus macerans]|uniref:hypothetical protein n=1 Tax=Paenibacillus macerans TaxID=44252 RepID=UPI002DB6F5BC|nr:hypothetical protein [Paenibacillus macerans]MEC0334180.1 hypothetical protein [Paenibacillus macerans]
MIGLKVIGISLLAAALFLYELPLLRAGKKKEKIAFTVLTLGGWGLGLVLLFVPGLPGPTELINYVFRPIWMLLTPEG